MNNKNHLIAEALFAGKNFKQIQKELNVSPNRVAAVNKYLSKQKRKKNSILLPEENENSGEYDSNDSSYDSNDRQLHNNSSNNDSIDNLLSDNDFLNNRNGSKYRINDSVTHQKCKFAALDISEIEQIVSIASNQLEFEKEMRSIVNEIDTKLITLLENQQLFNKNLEWDIQLKDAQNKLKAADRECRFLEMDNFLKLLFSRLKKLLEKIDVGLFSNELVQQYLEIAKNLKVEYQDLAIVYNLSFENSAHAKAIDAIIKLYEKTLSELVKDSKIVSALMFNSMFNLDIEIIKNILYQKDHHFD